MNLVSIIYIFKHLRWVLFALQWLDSNPQLPLQPECRLDFPGATWEAPWVPRCNSRIPQQLEKDHKVPSSLPDEALSHCSVSREIPRSLLNFETLLDTLDTTQKVPRHTSLTVEEHRVSWHNFIWAPSPLLIWHDGRLPFFVWKGIPTFLLHLRSRLVSHWNSRGSLVGCVTFRKTLISPSTQDKSRCPVTSSNVTLRMKSQHEGALTPQLHHLEKAAGSKYNSTSGLSPCEQRKRQAEFHSSTQDETWLSCSNSAETLRSKSEMERNPELPTSTQDEALFIPAAMREKSWGALRNAKEDLTSQRRHELSFS